MNLVFLPALINGMMVFFVGAVQDYTYGDIVIEPADDKNYIDNSYEVLQKVRSVNGVRDATQRLVAGSSIRYKQRVVGANVLGMIPKEEERVSKYPYIVSEGDFIGELAMDEILLGAMIAGTSSASQIYDSLEGLSVGSIVNVTYGNGVEKTYKVKGIHEGGTEMTDLNAIVHYKELESVLGVSAKGKASSIIIRIKNPGEEAEIKRKIIEAGVKEKVFTWQEKAEALVRQAIQSIGTIGIMSKVVSLIVGAALIFIIIYINTLHRKREIGILRAIGITPASIRISYVFISLFYVLAGIFLGLVMFFSLVLYLQANPLVFYESLTFSPEISFGDLGKSALIMIGMSIVAGFIPAWSVTRQSLLEAILGR